MEYGPMERKIETKFSLVVDLRRAIYRVLGNKDLKSIHAELNSLSLKLEPIERALHDQIHMIVEDMQA